MKKYISTVTRDTFIWFVFSSPEKDVRIIKKINSKKLRSLVALMCIFVNE